MSYQMSSAPARWNPKMLAVELDQECLDCYSRYWKTRDVNDIQKAVDAGRDAVRALPEESPIKGEVLNHLSASLSALFNHTQRIDVIEEAISCGKSAMARFNIGTSDWQKARNNCGILIFNRSNHFRSQKNINETISHLQSLIDSGSLDARYLPGTTSRLALTWVASYRATGRLEDLEKAVQVGHQSTADGNASDIRYDQASVIMFEHFQATGFMTSLDEALETSQLAIDNMSGPGYDDEARAVALRNRASMYQAKADRNRDTNPDLSIEFLRNALECGCNAIKYLPHDSPMAASIYSMQATCMGSMARLASDDEWSAQGISLLQDKAFCSNLRGFYDVDYTYLLSNLMNLYETHSGILQKKGKRALSDEMMGKAIEIGEQAIAKTPSNDSRLAERCKNVASMLMSKHLRTKDQTVLDRAKELFMIAAKTENASILVRVPASMQAAILHWYDGQKTEAHDLLQGAIKMLTASNIEAASTDDLQQTLREVSGLGSLAASVSLKMSKPPFEALTSIESAGCVIAGLSMDLRSEDSELQKHHPDLAESYRDVRSRFSQANRQLRVPGNYHNARKLQESLLIEMNNEEQRIRQNAGFERFQLPLDPQQVMALAKEGPVIVVNVSQLGSDAIIVKSDGIHSLPLPEMTLEALERNVSWISGIGNPARRDAVLLRTLRSQGSTEGAMLWLWNAAVHPILESMDTSSVDRVWWITSGRAGKAPFHAAGNYYGESQGNMNTASRVVSSYISSLKALKFSREQRPRHSAGHRMMLVTMPESPSPHQKLNTEHEERAINSAFLADHLLHLKHSDPQTVLDRLPEYSFVHFACHGTSVNSDPTKSGLLLVKDRYPAMLTIADLDAINLKEGSIAYLSACSTAEQTDGKLVSEAIHLANSFQALGFQHVIGTLWGADDRAAGQVAKGFYSRLASTLRKNVHEDGEPLDVAGALHGAVMEYRNGGDGCRISDWAPFIHIGV